MKVIRQARSVRCGRNEHDCVCSPSELFYTERAHLRTLKVLDSVFYQRLNRDSILPPEDIRHIFMNLEEIIQLHGKLTLTQCDPA